MREAIRVENISHRFGKKNVLENISVTFEEGKIYGLLGRNGSGKSTLISIIANQLIPDSGKVFVNGEYIGKNMDLLENICTVKEKETFSSDSRVKDIFNVYSLFFDSYDKEYEKYLTKKFNINIKKGYTGLSRGQKSAVAIITALSANAPITVFDEPTVGLDEANRKIFYDELIDRYSETGNTYIIATHMIGEMENIIEHAVIIDENKVVLDEDISDTLEKSYIVSGNEEDIRKLEFFDDMKHISRVGNTDTYFIYRNMNDDDIKNIRENNITIEHTDYRTVFLNVTGGGQI